jgi:hypothetical protein
MHGSQVWGTGFLQAGREFSSSLSTLHLHFLKGTLGMKMVLAYMTNVLVKITCSERGACSFNSPRPSSL